MTALQPSTLLRAAISVFGVLLQMTATPVAAQEGTSHLAAAGVARPVELASQRLAGFNARHRSASGRFLTSADVARKNATATSDIFKGISGLRVEIEQSGATKVIKMRGGSEGWCTPSLFVDGRHMSVTADEIDTMMQPRDIAGIEVYSEGNVPADFENGTNGCGGILVWTK